MELVCNQNCVICKQDSAVLKSKDVAPYFKYIRNTFFDKNQRAQNEFQKLSTDESLCSLCAHKGTLAHKLKDIYETQSQSLMIKKSRMSCFICNTKFADLILTDCNPNDFNIKIKSFMESSLYKKPYLQCAICMDCLFYLNVWFEIYSSLANMLLHMNNNPNKDGLEQDINVNGNGSKYSLRQGKSKKLWMCLKKSPSTRRTPIKKNEALNRTSRNNTSTNAINSVQTSSPDYPLKKYLLHLRPLKEMKKVWPQSILNDNKMFLLVPYVFLSRSRIETYPGNDEQLGNLKRYNMRKRISVLEEEESDSFEVIELSDSDETDIESTSKKILHHCHFCDKTFTTLCNYKKHMLWHDKPQKAMVPLCRIILPKYTKVSLYSQNNSCYKSKSETSEISPAKISELVKKYVGETHIFDERERNDVNEIDDINNVNSPESEDLLSETRESQSSLLTETNKSSNSNHIDDSITKTNDTTEPLPDNDSLGATEEDGSTKFANEIKEENAQNDEFDIYTAETQLLLIENETVNVQEETCGVEEEDQIPETCVNVEEISTKTNEVVEDQNIEVVNTNENNFGKNNEEENSKVPSESEVAKTNLKNDEVQGEETMRGVIEDRHSEKNDDDDYEDEEEEEENLKNIFDNDIKEVVELNRSRSRKISNLSIEKALAEIHGETEKEDQEMVLYDSDDSRKSTQNESDVEFTLVDDSIVSDNEMEVTEVSADSSNKENPRTNELNVETNELIVVTNEMNVETTELIIETSELTVETDELNVETNKLNTKTNELNIETNELNVVVNEFTVENKPIAVHETDKIEKKQKRVRKLEIQDNSDDDSDSDASNAKRIKIFQETQTIEIINQECSSVNHALLL